MKRHYCVACSKKKVESKMKQYLLPYVRGRTVWVCDVCFSRLTPLALEIRS